MCITGAILVVHLLLQFLNLEVFYQQNGQIYELSNRFDLDDESSVPTWFSQFLFLAVACAAFLTAYLERNRPRRRIWLGIGLLAVVFSLDEIATLHEYMLQTLHVILFQDAQPTAFANAWWLVGSVVVIIAGWTLWNIKKFLPIRTVTLFFVSGLIFWIGAIIFDGLTSFVPRESFLNQGVLVAIEETMELTGVALALYATLDYIERKHKRKISAALKQLTADD